MIKREKYNFVAPLSIVLPSQYCPHIETNQLICCVNQLTGFYMRATLAFNTFRKTLVMTLSLLYLFSFLPVLLFLIFHLKIPTLRKFHLDVFFYRHIFFSNQSQCCLTFDELSLIIMRHLSLQYLCYVQTQVYLCYFYVIYLSFSSLFLS